MVAVSSVGATPPGPTGGFVPVTLCHATGSETNPYVTITVDNQGQLNGHNNHSGDIIPAPDEGCPTGEPEPVLGCMDPEADNYNPQATQDDGSCTYTVLGCMDENALNYNPEATEDDGSCEYPPGPVYGCTDPEALNYNAQATVDDESCEYEPVCEVDYNGDEEGCGNPPPPACGTQGAEPCPPVDIPGCMNPDNQNYNPNATISDKSYCHVNPPSEWCSKLLEGRDDQPNWKEMPACVRWMKNSAGVNPLEALWLIIKAAFVK